MALRALARPPREPPRDAARRSFAVVPVSDAVDAATFAAKLAAALGPSTRVVDSPAIDEDLGRPGIAQIDDDEVGALRLAYHLEELEARHRHLVYLPIDDVDGVEPPGAALVGPRRARRRRPSRVRRRARTSESSGRPGASAST